MEFKGEVLGAPENLISAPLVFHAILAIVFLGFIVAGVATLTGCSSDSVGPTPPSPLDEILNSGASLGMNRTDWHPASKPAQLGDQYSRGGLLWHTPLEQVPTEHVVDVEASRGEGALRTFRIIYSPSDQGPSWAGIMRYVSQPVDPKRIEALEIWIHGDHGRLHLDFGYINEDINGDGVPETEDKDRDGAVDQFEDVGLDGVPDSLEEGYDPVTNPDPHGDNYYFLGEGKCPVSVDSCYIVQELQEAHDGRYYYRWLNGTEGNRNDLAALVKPDAEALSRNGFITRNGYRSFLVDLTTDDFVVPGSETPYGWRLIRIPLLDSAAVDTTILDYYGDIPDWGDITHIRVWFESDIAESAPDTVEIAAWSFVQTPSDSVKWVTDTLGQSECSFIRDYDYEVNRIFDLAYPGELGPNDSIVALLLYQSVDTGQEYEALPARLLVFPDSVDYAVSPPDDPFGEFGEHALVIPIASHFWYQYQTGTPHVVFSNPPAPWVALGAWMVVRRYDQQYNRLREDTIGRYGDTLMLKCLRPTLSNWHPSHPAWNLMWRNVYSIPRLFPPEDLGLQIYKGPAGSEGNPSNLPYQLTGSHIDDYYITILGLDQYNRQGITRPDGILDDRIDVFRPDWGVVIFPSRTPFNSDTTFTYAEGNRSVSLAERVPTLYNYTSETERVSQTEYYLQVRTSNLYEYYYPGENVIVVPGLMRRGSVKIYRSGYPLTDFVDFVVDYENSRIKLITSRARDESKELLVIYDRGVRPT